MSNYANQKRDNSAMQVYQGKTLTLVVNDPDSDDGAAVSFKVPIPDNRVRCEITVLYVPAAGEELISDLAPANATLWLYTLAEDRSGVSGIELPVVNVEGSATTPTPIPTAAGLYGYSRSFQTLGHAIGGAFNTDAVSQPGTWQLQTTYCPDGVRFTPEEWDQITRECNPSLITPPVKLV